MKKIVNIVLLIILCVLSINGFSCNKKKQEIVCVVPDGAPALAFSKYMIDNQNFGIEIPFSYKVVASSSIGEEIIKGADIVVAPINLASKLYKVDKNQYKMVSVVTHGNMFIMSKNGYSLFDLQGKVVGVIGHGLVPDLTFKSILQKNNIEYIESETPVKDKVAIKYYSSGSEILPALKTDKIEVGLVPEPLATKLSSVAPAYSYRLSLQSLYDSENKSYPQAVVLIKENLLKTYPNIVKNMETEFADNKYLSENIESVCDTISKHIVEEVTPSFTFSNVNSDVINGCNIFWQNASDAKNSVVKYLQDIINIESSSAQTVEDGFFYNEE